MTLKVEVRAGFEPANNGFADHRLGPLGYRTMGVHYTTLGVPGDCSPNKPVSEKQIRRDRE